MTATIPRKRLLLISSNSSERGGGERYLVYLTQGLRSIGCEVHVLLSSFGYMDSWAQQLAHAGALVHRRNFVGLRHRPLRFIQSMLDKKQQAEVAEVCRQLAPDAVLVNQQYDEDGLDYLSGALMSGVASVGGLMHMPMTADKHKRPLGALRGKLLSSWYKNHPYKLIFVSKGAEQEFADYYKPLSLHSNVVNNGCLFPEVKDRQIFHNGWTRRDDLPVIGFVGQFVPQKNLPLLIDAWLWASQHGLSTRLLLVGDGPDRKAVENKLTNAAQRDMWCVTGWQEKPERYLSALDIYMMTSRFEGLPLALIEAVGNGLPAVVSNFNGATDVAARASWVKVVDDYNAGSLGAALMDLAAKMPALKLEAKSGQAEFREYFSLERMACETLSALGVA